MNLVLKNYMEDNLIIADMPESLPQEFWRILDQHLEIVENYYAEKSRITKQQKILNYFSTTSTNKYQSALSNIITVAANYLIEHNFWVMGFHCTRLLKEEVDDINKNGFCFFDKKKHFAKLNLLYQHGFNSQEINQLKAYSYTEDKYRTNRVFFLYDTYSINNQDYVKDFFEIWGGEITNWKINKTELQHKLKSIGAPYLFIVKTKFDRIDFESLIRNILDNKYLNTRINVSNKNFSDKESIQILASVCFDYKKDRLIYQK